MMQLKSSAKNKKSLAVLYLFYPNGKKYSKTKPIHQLKKILSRFECDKTIVYIDNAAKEEFSKKISGNEYEISGNNSFLEFSGWQKGIDFVRNNDIYHDALLIVNDTFSYNSFLDRWLINHATLECALQHNSVIGKRVSLPLTGQIMGNSLIPHIRTHMFLASRKVVDSLGSIVSIDENIIERTFTSSYDPSLALFRKDAPISGEIKRYIFSYLVSGWYRKKPYTSQNFKNLKRKATSMVNSLLLSIRIRDLGYPLIPYHKAKQFLTKPVSTDKINRLWNNGAKNVQKRPVASVNDEFWSNNLPHYARIPEKKTPFSWKNFRNALEGRSFPGHF